MPRVSYEYMAVFEPETRADFPKPLFHDRRSKNGHAIIFRLNYRLTQATNNVPLTIFPHSAYHAIIRYYMEYVLPENIYSTDVRVITT